MKTEQDFLRQLVKELDPKTATATTDLQARTFALRIAEDRLSRNSRNRMLAVLDNVVAELPVYVSHKKVRAAPITKVGASHLVLATGYTIELPPDYFSKHNPQVGGYFVAYNDVTGPYYSFSLRNPFEWEYTLAQKVS